MSLYSNKNQQEEEMVAVLEWNALRTSKRTTAYSLNELEALKRPAPIPGTGYVYYNPHRDTYEKPRSINVLPKAKLEAIQTQTRSASLGKKTDTSSDNGSGLSSVPVNVRLHQLYENNTRFVGLGFSVV